MPGLRAGARSRRRRRGGHGCFAAAAHGKPGRKAASWSRRCWSTFRARHVHERRDIRPGSADFAFDDEDEGVRPGQRPSPYGLAAYAFTQNLSRAWRLAESLEAGTVAINDSVPSTSQCPFGGMKESGWGRELGTEGMDAFLDTKHISLGIQE